MKKKTTCKACGKDIDYEDSDFNLVPLAFKDYCGECINAGLLWGMERWVDAGAPGAKKI